MNLKKETKTGAIPVFQKVLETVRGGLSLTGAADFKAANPDAQFIPAGAVLIYEEDKRTARVVLKEEELDVAGIVIGYLYENTPIEDGAFVDVVVRGTAYYNRLPQFVKKLPEMFLNEQAPLVILSKSY